MGADARGHPHHRRVRRQQFEDARTARPRRICGGRSEGAWHCSDVRTHPRGVCASRRDLSGYRGGNAVARSQQASRPNAINDLVANGLAQHPQSGGPAARPFSRWTAHGDYNARRERTTGLGDPSAGRPRRARNDENIQSHSPPGAQPSRSGARADAKRGTRTRTASIGSRKRSRIAGKIGYVTTHVTKRGSRRARTEIC